MCPSIFYETVRLYNEKVIDEYQRMLSIQHYGSALNTFAFNDPKHFPKESVKVSSNKEKEDSKKPLSYLSDKLIRMAKANDKNK